MYQTIRHCLPLACSCASGRAEKIVGVLVTALALSAVHADDAEIGKLLADKGAKVTATKGIVTGLSIDDASKLTDDDFQQMGRLSHLKTLSLSKGLTNERLSCLATLTELEYLQTNLMQVSDEGLKPLGQLKNLRNAKFFHPGNEFNGTGLAHLAELPKLESLTVAGSLAFNDEGMAAVAKLTKLQEFRMWHAGPTVEGVKQLRGLPNLKRLHLGQRLTYKPPACPSDDTIAILAEIKSLESLQLGEARLSGAALRKLKQLPALQKLVLEGIDMPPTELEQLRKDLAEVKVEWTAPNEAYQKRIRALSGSD